VGATRGNSYFVLSVVAGEHHLCVDWVSSWVPSGRVVARYGFTAEAGKVYYFRARTIGGLPSLTGDRSDYGAWVDLDLVNVDEGKMLVASSPLAISHAKK
jgi:hypothetical protein